MIASERLDAVFPWLIDGHPATIREARAYAWSVLADPARSELEKEHAATWIAWILVNAPGSQFLDVLHGGRCPCAACEALR